MGKVTHAVVPRRNHYGTFRGRPVAEEIACALFWKYAVRVQIGDLVRLRTGGAAMMVASVNGDDVECVQYDGNQCVRATFPVESLEPARTLNSTGVSRYFE